MYQNMQLSRCLSLQWIEEVKPMRMIICSDSNAALTSIKHASSNCRQDILNDILQSLYRIIRLDIDVTFMWVPAHVDIQRNETVHLIAAEENSACLAG